MTVKARSEEVLVTNGGSEPTRRAAYLAPRAISREVSGKNELKGNVMAGTTFTTATEGATGFVLGTRPELIKLAPVIQKLGTGAVVIYTGQHYDTSLYSMIRDDLGLQDNFVELKVDAGSRGQQLGRMIVDVVGALGSAGLRRVVVQGDTTSALAGALSANTLDLPLAHVEAGLRSFDRRMPEEHNRVLIDHLSDMCFVPTNVGEANLLREGIEEHRISVTGNTIVEALTSSLRRGGSGRVLLRELGLVESEYVLATFHRPENVDSPSTWASILLQLSQLSMPAVVPLHPRAIARIEEFGLQSHLARLRIIPPVGHSDFIRLVKMSALVISDSGGLQEEVSVLKRPILVVRRSTERPEIMGSFGRLIQAHDLGRVTEEWLQMLPALHSRLKDKPSPYGDGRASERIVQALRSMS